MSGPVRHRVGHAHPRKRPGDSGQTVPAGSFAALTDALLTDTAYGNIRTAASPAGEIRGQVRHGRDDD